MNASTFSFSTASQIIFGEGSANTLAEKINSIGKAPLLVTGSNSERAVQLLSRDKIKYHLFSISGEPTCETVRKGIKVARKRKCDCVVAIGGGSVIDAGKAISALITNEGVLLDYLEVIGEGKALSKPTAPLIAVPTTAGTGAEVTKNAVLKSEDHNVKASMRSTLMLPNIALVDPLLTHSVPKDITASTGLDALTQVIEPFLSHRANPLTSAICKDGILRAARSLKVAFDDGQNAEARYDMALASLYGGLALANAGLGAVHGFAAPIGGMFDIPHGVICGRLLPFVFKANMDAASEDKSLQVKASELAALLTQKSDATISDGINWLTDLCNHLNIRGFASYGMTEAHIDEVVVKAQKASSMKANPIQLSSEQLKSILTQAL